MPDNRFYPRSRYVPRHLAASSVALIRCHRVRYHHTTGKMRFHWMLALTLWGCASIEHLEDTSPATLDATWQELPAWMAETAPTETTADRQAVSALPEGTLVFDEAPVFVPGETETLTVSGATPGSNVFFIVGPFSEDHICPAALGGLCMDIDFSQGRYLGKAVAMTAAWRRSTSPYPAPSA